MTEPENVFSLNACIANEKPIVAKLRLGDSLSGRLKEMNDREMSRIDRELGTNKLSILYIPCFSLNTILSAINIKKVDYFSLDVEGGELDVLKSIQYDKITALHNEGVKELYNEIQILKNRISALENKIS